MRTRGGLWPRMRWVESIAPEASSLLGDLRSSKLELEMEYETVKQKLEALNEEKDVVIWELFCANAWRVVQASCIQPHTVNVAKACGGHLLAIVIMARALKDVNDVLVWEDASHSLGLQCPTEVEDKVLFNAVAFSWEHLGSAKEFVKYCASSMKSEGMSEVHLIQEWIGGSLVGTVDEGEKIIDDLVNAFLLEKGDCVRMRDEIREVSLKMFISQYKHPPLLEPTETPDDEAWKKARWMDLANTKLSQLPESPNCPQLRHLSLQTNPYLREIPPLFFENMHALQILNLSYTRINTLPPSLFKLGRLRDLFVRGCELLIELPPEIGELKKLEVLDLEGTEIINLPMEVGKLTRLKCLKVSFYGYNHEEDVTSDQSNAMVPQNVIANLVQLREISIDVSPEDKRWEMTVKDVIKEVCTLEQLKSVKLYLPEVVLLKELMGDGRTSSSMNLSFEQFGFTVGIHLKPIISRLPREVAVKFEQEERSLKYVKGDKVPDEFKKALQHATALFLDRHSTVTSLSKFGIGNMKQLEFCVLGECNEIETIMDGDEIYGGDEGDFNEESILGSLWYLGVYYMKSLRSMWKGPSLKPCLSNLKSLAFYCCPQLITIFTSALLQNLNTLEELVVQDCPEIIRLVDGENCSSSEFKWFLPRLKKISLHYMPKLVSISTGLPIAPELEWMSFYGCWRLETLSMEVASISNLKVIIGEVAWWSALQWSGPNSEIVSKFVPIERDRDLWTQLAEISYQPQVGKKENKPSQRTEAGTSSEVKKPFPLPPSPQLPEDPLKMDFVGGATFGAIFQTLLDAVLEGRKKASGFDSILEQIQTTLKSVHPSIHEIEKLDLPKDETNKAIQILTDGEKLIRKLSNVSSINIYKKRKYAKQLRCFRHDIEALKKKNTPEIQLPSSKTSSWSTSDNFKFLASCEAPPPPAFVVGLDDPLRELKRQLFVERRSRIVVSAPVGCGKTTLVKKLCQDPDVKGKYNIFYVVVSRTPNVIAIIKKLFQHNKYAVPEFTNEEDAVNQLELLLDKKQPILFVLDDVWCGSESLLDKFQSSECKVLVTSRYEFPGFGSTYKLKLLSEKDATTLFCHSAFPEGGSSSPTIPEYLVTEMVRHCNGFPLALKVVGSSLLGQPVEVWQLRMKRIHKFGSIVSAEDELRDKLQRSLNALDSENILKECFNDLGSFSELEEIPATVLIDMWAELYDSGLLAVSILQKLCFHNLLSLVVTRGDASEIDDFYIDTIAVQHDLLRKLAIYESGKEPRKKRKRLIVDLSGNRLPEWWTEEKQQPLNARLVSFSTDEKFSSSWCNMKLPKAEVLILNFQTKKNYKLPEFMEQMDKLKVLVVRNYGSNIAELINFSPGRYLSSLKRVRLERVSIPTFCNTTIDLRNLEKITLEMCKVGQAFEGSPIPIQEMLPNLMEININCCYDLVKFPEWLCDLVGLNKLVITNCHKLSALPEAIGKLGKLQMLSVRYCSKLSKLPDTIESLHKLSILDITGCSSMREMPRNIGKLCSLRKLHMRRCGSLQELPQSMIDLVNLETVICDNWTAQLWESFEQLPSNLKITVAQESASLNWLV